MADRRTIETVLAGKETISPAARRAGAALDDLADEFKDAARAADKLDRQIDDVNANLRQLATAYGTTGNKEFVKQIREQEAELRRLTKARRLIGDRDDGSVLGDGRAEGVRFAGRLAEGVTAGLSRAGGPIAAALSNVFGTLPPQAQAAIGAGVLSAVAAVAPGIGALVAGAVTAGVGSGAVALGVAAAFSDSRVKTAASALGATVKAEFADIGADFAGDTVAAMRKIGSAVRSLGLREAFAPAAGYIRPLTDGLLGLIRNALPGLKTAIAAADKPIRAIASSLPRLGTAVGSLLSTFAKYADEGAAALTMLFDVVIGGIKIIEANVAALAQMFRWFDKLPTWMTGVAGTWIDAAKQSGQATEGWDTSLEGLHAALTGTGAAAAGATPPIKSMAEAMRESAEAARTLYDAETDMEEAIDSATAAARENGRTTDSNTAKGRANRGALSALAAATLRHRDATLAQTRSSVAVDAVMRRGYTAFIRAATAMGMSKQAADRLARSLGLIKPVKDVAIHVSTKSAVSAVDYLRYKIASLKSRHVYVSGTVRWTHRGLHVPGGTILAGNNRWGGVYQHAQQGLLNAQTFTSQAPARYAFAEPATGGEAFVPRRGNYARSMNILSQAASWYGADVVPGGNGGGRAANVTVAPGAAAVGAEAMFVTMVLHLLRTDKLRLTVNSANRVKPV